MAECPEFTHLLIVPRIRVQNANAISSPLTHGFPSMTAFLGLMWALERKTKQAGLDLQFNAVSVVAHDYDEQTTDDYFLKNYRLTRNPVGKDGKPTAIVEEGRIHLEISLVFAVQSEALKNEEEKDRIAAQVRDMIYTMRVAGGSVLPPLKALKRNQPHVVALTGNETDQDQIFQSAKMRLLPGYVLVERHDILENRHKALLEHNPSASKLDAWLSLNAIHWRYHAEAEPAAGVAELSSNTDKNTWQHDRKNLGWLVPIPVGFGALTELKEAGSVANSRDNTTPFRFVESVFGVGQWISPYQIQHPKHLLWYAESQADLYRCRNDYGTYVSRITDYQFD